MRRAICLSVLLPAICGTGPVQAASPYASGAQVHRRLIQLDIHLYAALPLGSMVVCKAQLIAEPGQATPRLDPAPAAEGDAILQGASGECRVEIPLCWTGNGLPSGVTLRYEIDAETRSGAPPVVLKRGLLTAPAGSAAYPTLTLSLAANP